MRLYPLLIIPFVFYSVGYSLLPDYLQLNMPSIKKIEGLAQSTPGCISLAQGALRLGGVSNLIKTPIESIFLSDKADFYGDPLGMLPLREKIATTLNKKHNTSITTDRICIGVGGVGVLASLMLTLLTNNDEVILAEPAYPIYANLVQIGKAKPIFCKGYKLTQKTNHHHEWLFDIDSIKAAASTKTKMLILSNPSNPTGTCLTQEQLDALVSFCLEKKIYLVIDEVYDDFVYEGSFTSSTNAAATTEHVIRIGSFSKNFGMSGYRVGYAIAAPSIITALAPIQASLIGNPTIISQYTALEALNHYELVATYAAQLKKNRDLICAFFDRLEAQGIVTYGYPQAGFYIFFKTPDESSTNFALNVLENALVAIAPGNDFGPSVQQYARLCFARSEEIIRTSIDRLTKYFSEKHNFQPH